MPRRNEAGATEIDPCGRELMTGAKPLLLEVLAVIPDGKTVAPLFAEDGVVELPFLHSVGIEPRYEGRPAIAGFMTL
jgi:hypothetical protein